jgi:hypothetical protein
MVEQIWQHLHNIHWPFRMSINQSPK